MKISEKTRIIILLSIGIIFILMGLVQAIFDFEIDKKISDNISFILMIAALFVFFSNKKRKPEQEQQEDEGQEEQSETDLSDSEDIQDKQE
ncbi:MAG: hypothetical protein PHP06_05245 [Clostridia bacterium]|nr:hypothetical protein [Clostridia bacterium]